MSFRAVELMTVESDIAFECQTLWEWILWFQALRYETEDPLGLLVEKQLEPMFYAVGVETSAAWELESELAWTKKQV